MLAPLTAVRCVKPGRPKVVDQARRHPRGVPHDQAGQQAALVGRQTRRSRGGARPAAHRRRAAPAAGARAAPAAHAPRPPPRPAGRSRLAPAGRSGPAVAPAAVRPSVGPERAPAPEHECGSAARVPRPGPGAPGTMSRSPNLRSPRVRPGCSTGSAVTTPEADAVAPSLASPASPLPRTASSLRAPTVDPASRHSRTSTTPRAIPLRPARPARTAATISDRPIPSRTSQPTERPAGAPVPTKAPTQAATAGPASRASSGSDVPAWTSPWSGGPLTRSRPDGGRPAWPHLSPTPHRARRPS